ncbi:MAG: hypothetical protein LUD19_06180 [Clostridia bacterium]|nr:hypothetical protein [Clostridia bacterium]
MSVEIKNIDTADSVYEVKQLRTENVYKEAYIDRYRRLGYSETAREIQVENGKKYAVITLQRDKTSPEYGKLSALEGEIMDLVSVKEGEEKPVPQKKAGGRKIALRVIFCAGVVLAALGVALLIAGMLINLMIVALAGWAVAIIGAACLIVWSFLRESWRMRKKDIKDEADNPGFGDDEISRQVEDKLCAADKVRAGMAAD